MADARRGLGRGLGALIAGGRPEDDPQAVYLEVDPDQVRPNPRQPRSVFDDDALAELADSIRQIGLLQPIVVRRVAAESTPFELVAGERRWRAARLAGLERIPAIVRGTDDDALLRDALVENLHRVQLNPLEEAAAYAQLLADFGGTQEDLAQRLGRSRPQVANTLRLLNLPTGVQRRVAAGVLTAGHARALLALDDPASMEALADRVVAEGLSVRSVEEIVAMGAPTPARRKRTATNPEVSAVVAELAELIGDHLDTRVRVEGVRTARSRGRVVIDVADLADLRRIAERLAP
jgi:ParB family chromosome partitioning protein